MTGKRVLITGGLGFIGSSLAIRLVKSRARVTILDALIPHYGGNRFNIESIKNKVEVIIGDVRDNKLIERLVREKDVIFSLAGTLSHIDSMTDPFTDLEINCTSQLSLLEACRKINPTARILFAGTRNQYGRARYTPVDEQHPMEPIDVNGINNIAAEWYFRLYHNIHGLWTCSLRMTNTYGSRHQMKHPKQGVLNWFLRQLIDGEGVKLYGTGEQVRDINYIDDVVEAFVAAAKSDAAKGEVFNLGGDPISLKKFVEMSIVILGGGSFQTVNFPKNRQNIEPGNYIADYSKIKKMLKWSPRVCLEDGIKQTLEYYRKYQSHYW